MRTKEMNELEPVDYVTKIFKPKKRIYGLLLVFTLLSICLSNCLSFSLSLNILQSHDLMNIGATSFILVYDE